jgi:hypothetical protein
MAAASNCEVVAPAAPGPLPGETRIGRLTAELHTPFDAFERASDAVGRGNLKVFEEIGLEFARYLQEHPPDAPAESPSFQRSSTDCGPATRPMGSARRSRATSARVSSTSMGRFLVASTSRLWIGYWTPVREPRCWSPNDRVESATRPEPGTFTLAMPLGPVVTRFRLWTVPSPPRFHTAAK